MYSICLSWKEYNISLAAVEAWMKSEIGSGYRGNSADTQLVLWFENELSEQQVQQIQDYWNNITEDSPEAINYVTQQDITQRIEELKAEIPTKTWNQLNTAQRKIVVGLSPTLEDLGL